MAGATEFPHGASRSRNKAPDLPILALAISPAGSVLPDKAVRKPIHRGLTFQIRDTKNMQTLNPELLNILKAADLEPFNRLSESSLRELACSARVFDLRAGESVALNPASGHYVSAGWGEIRIGTGHESSQTRAPGQRPYLAQGGPLRLDAITDCGVILADCDMVDFLTGWEELASHAREQDSDLWSRLRLLSRATAFRSLPMGCVEAALARMSPRRVGAGEEIVRQGEVGDAFYVIWSGRAEVWRTGLHDDEPRKVDEMDAGDEALVTGGTRNATVRMITDGELLVLGREDFRTLLANPLIEEVSPEVARSLVADGAEWLDVRYQEEYEETRIPGARLIPLHELRASADGRLDPARRYVIYCRSGKRSAVAATAMLLSQRQFKVVSLQGGLNAWPHETRSDF